MGEKAEQRRLSAILAADVVGYTRQMEADTDATVAAWKTARLDIINPAISSHSGRIVKLTGDGFLAEFTTVLDAVKCAVFMQDALSSNALDFRMGIHLGDIIDDGEDIHGEGVNIAARIEALCETGGVNISASVHEQVINRLDQKFEDMGAFQVKNVTRPIRVFRVLSGAAGKAQSNKTKNLRRKRMLALSVAALAIAGVTGLVFGYRFMVQEATPPSLSQATDQPIIAVLPFENLSKDPTEDYFSDGLSEDIINALGQYRGLAVIAYNAAQSYHRGSGNFQKLGDTLGVRYIVEGSVRRTGNKIRISTRLTDAKQGILLWSERFDNESKNVFEIQDAITRRVAGTIISNLTRIEQKRSFAKSTEVLGAYDLVLRGRAELRRATRRANRNAIQLFKRAIELDSNYAAAYAWLGRANYQAATDGWSEFMAETLERAEQYAQQASALDPRNVEALRTLARIHSLKFQIDRALIEINQALAINPSDAEALADRGIIHVWEGRPQEAIAALKLAFVYDPNLRGDAVFAQGLAYYLLRRHKDAIQVLERGVARYPDFFFIRVGLAAAYGQLGQINEAQRNAREVRRLFPIFDPSTFGTRIKNSDFRDYLIEGMKKGGLQ